MGQKIKRVNFECVNKDQENGSHQGHGIGETGRGI